MFDNARSTLRIALLTDMKTAIEQQRRIKAFRRAFNSQVTIRDGAISNYYDVKFGRYDPSLDIWRSEANTLKGNPQLRRLDIVAEALFRNGFFRIIKITNVFSPFYELGLPSFEGTVACISLFNPSSGISGALFLDIADDIKFTRFLLSNSQDSHFVVRLSLASKGIVIRQTTSDAENKIRSRSRLESIRDPVGDIPVFHTIRETIEALRTALTL